jgi:hypothetical protein
MMNSPDEYHDEHKVNLSFDNSSADMEGYLIACDREPKTVKDYVR